MDRLRLCLSTLILLLLLLTFSVDGLVDITLGDINVIFLSDLNGFVSNKNGDFTLGSVLSFVEQLRILNPNKDVYLAYGGGLVGDNGMPTSTVLSVMERMPWDLLLLGTSDVTGKQQWDELNQPGGFLSWFSQEYVSTNLQLTTTSHGDKNKHSKLQHYKLIEGYASTLFVLGFLDELLTDHNGAHDDTATTLDSSVAVQRYSDAFVQNGIVEALESNNYDAVLVLTHNVPSTKSIHELIRRYVDKTMPIQFLSGGKGEMDNKNDEAEIPDFYTRSFSNVGSHFQSMGIVTIPKFQESSGEFQHAVIEASRSGLHTILPGRDEDRTSQGQALEDFIVSARNKYNLDDYMGCSPRPFLVSRQVGGHDNDDDLDSFLWDLWKEEIVPTTFLAHDGRPKVLLQRTTVPLLWSMDLPGGWLRLDDLYMTSPTTQTFHLVAKEVKADILLDLYDSLNTDSERDMTKSEFGLQDYIVIGEVELDQGRTYDLYTLGHDVAVNNLAPALDNYLNDHSKKKKKKNRASLKEQVVDTEILPVQLLLDFVKREWSNCSTTKWHLVDEEDELENPLPLIKHARKARGMVGTGITLGLTTLLFLLLLIRNKRHDDEMYSYEFELVSGADDEDGEEVTQRQVV